MLIEPSRGHLKTILELLDEPMNPAERVRLTRHAAEAALVAGWLSFNLDRRADARVYFMLAEQLAWEAGARDVLARALGSASLLPSPTFRGGAGGDTTAATALTDQAHALATACPPQARSWLAGRAAVEQAAAKVGAAVRPCPAGVGASRSLWRVGRSPRWAVRRIRGVRARLDSRCANLACVRELDELLRLRP